MRAKGSPHKFNSKLVALVVAMTLTAAACSEDKASNPPVPDYPHGADQLVFALRPTGSGEYNNRSYWLYGNRRVFVIDGAIGPTGKFPVGPPESPPFKITPNRIRTTIISQNLMNTIVTSLQEAGLFNNRTPDLGTVRGRGRGYHNVLVHGGGVSHELTYADTVWEEGPKLTERQNEIRGRINDIMQRIYSAVVKNPSNYDPDRVALIVKRGGRMLTPDTGVVQDWPLQGFDQTMSWEGTEHNGGKCMIVSTEQAGKISDTLRTTDKPVAWQWQGDLYRVWPHPLLPDEKDCSSLHTYFILPPEAG